MNNKRPKLFFKNEKGRYEEWHEPERPAYDNALYRRIGNDEKWKDIEGYEGIYKISNYGRIKSFAQVKWGRLIKPSMDRFGYLRIWIGNKNYFVHKLVAKYFVSGYDERLGVCHKDGNKENNYFMNLQYVTLQCKMEKIRQKKLLPKIEEKKITKKKKRAESKKTDELWKDIKCYEGYYQVSNKGRVRSLDRNIGNATIKGRILRQKKDKKGYCRVNLQVDSIKKYFTVHRLVAKAFLNNPDNLPCVNHKDENPSNNRVDNLEWCTHLYNMRYGTAIERAAKTRRKVVVQSTMDGVLICEYKSLTQASKETGIAKSVIGRRCRGEVECKDFKWEYKNAK